jgi:hypothetical protein
MSKDLVGMTASNLLEMGLDAESTSAIVEMLDEYGRMLREQLALEIEAEMRNTREFDTLNNARNTGLRRAAFIVRGGKKNG